jgi:hypothetical protein
MTIADSVAKLISKQVETVVDFLTKPMGVYEFRDALVKNFREFLIEVASGRPYLGMTSRAKITRE